MSAFEKSQENLLTYDGVTGAFNTPQLEEKFPSEPPKSTSSSTTPPSQPQKFFGEDDINNIDPRTILTVLDCYPPFNGDEYWQYFEIAYPDTKFCIWSLRSALNNFKRQTITAQFKFKPVDLLHISPKELGDNLVEYLTGRSPNPLQWTNEKKDLQNQVNNIRDLWGNLHDKIHSVVDKRLEQPLIFGYHVGAVIDQLEKGLEEVDEKIEGAQRVEIERRRKESLGIIEKLWEFRCRQRDKPWSKLWEDFLGAMGSSETMLSIIIISALAGAMTTALATWKCTPPDTIPTIDSNFWSTLSSSIIATAGLYCILIPRLRGSKLEVSNEMLFYGLLTVSLVTALVSIPSYIYQTRVSLVMLFVSSAAQLAVTLQLILGADAKILETVGEIQHQGEMIMGLESEIEFLRDR